MEYPKCPNCKEVCSPYGLPYGLQIGSSDENQATDLHSIILIQCNKCGTVLGGYEKESLGEKD